MPSFPVRKGVLGVWGRLGRRVLPEFPPVLDERKLSELEAEFALREVEIGAHIKIAQSSNRMDTTASPHSNSDPIPSTSAAVEVAAVEFSDSGASGGHVVAGSSMKKEDESVEEWESRVAVEDLDRLLQEDSCAVRLAKFRTEQRERKKKRGRTLTVEDYVSPRDSSAEPVRPPTPPGPPEPVRPLPVVPPRPDRPPGGSIHLGRRPPILRGIMFGGLKEIPTSDVLDPPTGVCFKCWESGHRRSECRSELKQRFCSNCGRREVTVTDCPRCGEAHAKDMHDKFGAAALDRHRQRRRRYYEYQFGERKPSRQLPDARQVPDDRQVPDVLQLPGSRLRSSSVEVGESNVTRLNFIEEFNLLCELLKGLPAEAVREAKLTFLKEYGKKKD